MHNLSNIATVHVNPLPKHIINTLVMTNLLFQTHEHDPIQFYRQPTIEQMHTVIILFRGMLLFV